jgi:hypothetical protein
MIPSIFVTDSTSIILLTLTSKLAQQQPLRNIPQVHAVAGPVARQYIPDRSKLYNLNLRINSAKIACFKLGHLPSFFDVPNTDVWPTNSNCSITPRSSRRPRWLRCASRCLSPWSHVHNQTGSSRCRSASPARAVFAWHSPRTPTIDGNLQETSLHAGKLRGGLGRRAAGVSGAEHRSACPQRLGSGDAQVTKPIMTTGGPPCGMMTVDAVDDSRPPTETTETCTGTGTGRSNWTVHSPLAGRSRSASKNWSLHAEAF